MRQSVTVPRGLLVLGGTSEIGLAVAERWVRLGTDQVVLAGRDGPRLEAAAERLRALGAEVGTLPFEAEDPASHEEVVEKAFGQAPLDTALLAFGVLGDQAEEERDPVRAAHTARVNYVGGVSAGLAVARRFAGQGHGTVVVLSSVAGVRARPDNFVYGSSKAGLDAFAEGLGHRYRREGVRVLTVRPGFVRTRMTRGLPEAPFATDAAAVARAVVAGAARGAEVVWAPGALRFVMTAFRALPRPAVRRLSR